MSMIRISDLTFGYEGSYDLIFENLNLQLDGSWRLGLVGRNGRGKTTLLRLLMGEQAYRGKIVSDLSFSGGKSRRGHPFGDGKGQSLL